MARPKSKENMSTAEVLQMSLEEARAYRLKAHQAKKPSLTETQTKEEFRKFWATEKKSYGKPKELEDILWIHAKAMKMDTPEQFSKSIEHFGLKKLGEK